MCASLTLVVQHNIWEASTAKYSWVGWKGEATSSRNNINLINSRVLRKDFFLLLLGSGQCDVSEWVKALPVITKLCWLRKWLAFVTHSTENCDALWSRRNLIRKMGLLCVARCESPIGGLIQFLRRNGTSKRCWVAWILNSSSLLLFTQIYSVERSVTRLELIATLVRFRESLGAWKSSIGKVSSAPRSWQRSRRVELPITKALTEWRRRRKQPRPLEKCQSISYELLFSTLCFFLSFMFLISNFLCDILQYFQLMRTFFFVEPSNVKKKVKDK